MALSFQYRDRSTPGNPIYTITTQQWRALLSTYVKDVDSMQNALVADTNWFTAPTFDLWQTNGAFNPTTSTVANASRKDTHRRGDPIS